MYNILVCDDEKDIVSALKIYLESDGYKVFTAFNGKEAIEIAETQEIHLILLDIMMPVMDGIEAAKTIRHLEREDAAEIPIIALSANVYTEDVAASSAAGMNGHLSKPINFDTLCKTVYNAAKK